MTHGVSFPAGPDGRHSTIRAGRAVVADALRPVDPVGALAAGQETAWRSGYVLHFRRLVEAGIASPEDWLSIADAGLDAVRRTMVVTAEGGTEQPLGESLHVVEQDDVDHLCTPVVERVISDEPRS